MKSKLDQLIEQTTNASKKLGKGTKKIDVSPLDATLLNVIAGGLQDNNCGGADSWHNTGNYWQDL